MRITKIAEDSAGYKLIAARRVDKQGDFVYGSTRFFDFKNGVLRVFESGSVREFTGLTYKGALRFILRY